MKKVFGILFIIIGVFLMIGGASALTDVSTRNDSFEGQLGNTFSEGYRQDNSEQQIIGFIMIAVGLTLLIIGIVMTASKSKQSNNVLSNHPDIGNLSKQSMTFYNNKDYLSAIAVLKRILELNPRDNITYFNLSCCYSLTENIEGLNSLSKAVEYGYTNFERIKNYEALNWLRSQKEFEDFLNNGYKLTKPLTAQSTSQKTQNVNYDDKLVQLEKLGKLKEQGLLNDDEFQEQKKKILN